MGIAVVGTPTTAEATGTAALTQNVPTGVVDGNVLVWIVGAGTATNITTPTGWSVAQTGTTTACTLHCWYRVAASEPANYTTGTRPAGRCSGTMVAYSGVDTGTPIDVTAPAMVGGTTATTAPASTPVTAGAWVIGAAAGIDGVGVTTGAYTADNSTLDQSTTSTTTSTNVVTAAAHFAWSSGAFTPTFTCSQTTTRTLGASFVLRPAADAASGTPSLRLVNPRRAPVRLGRYTPQQGIVVSGPQAYTSSVSATVGFTGSNTVSTRKSTSATVSFTGAQTRRTSSGVTATVGFTGSITKRLARALTATVAFTGALTTLAVHLFTQALTATLSFTGTQVRRTATAKTAALSFTGTQARTVGKGVTATVSFTGTQARRVGHGLAAALSFTGALTRRVAHPFTATVSFTGSHTTLAVHFFTQAFTATVGFTGTLAKRTTHGITAAVGFTVGALTRRISHTQTATVGFVGGMGRRVGHGLSAAVGFVGTLLGVKSGATAPLVPEVTLVAATYDHVLAATTLNRAPQAASTTHSLTAATRANTLTASTLDRTIEET